MIYSPLQTAAWCSDSALDTLPVRGLVAFLEHHLLMP
jgi:hypothetical protein